MVNSLKHKNSSTKIKILKSRKLDFIRINPFAIMQIGINRLMRRGFINKKTELINDNSNHFVSKSFLLHWSKSRFNDSDFHIGFSVSKKNISKLAVKRNLVKRRLRVLINDNLRNYKLAGYDFVITARAGFLDTSFSDLTDEIKKALQFAEHKIQNFRK